MILTAILGFFLSLSHMLHESGNGGTVALGRCDIIVNDTLGDLPDEHGGPLSTAENGNGVMCDVCRW